MMLLWQELEKLLQLLLNLINMHLLLVVLILIDRCDLRAKDVVLFATMNSSGGAASVERMAEKVKLRGARVIETFTLKTKGNRQ